MPEPSAPMRLAQAAAPPSAFLDFCRRQPSDCGGAPAAVIQQVAQIELQQRTAAEARFATGRNRNNLVATSAVQTRSASWSQTFAEARRRREALDINLTVAPPTYDWSGLFAAAKADQQVPAEVSSSNAPPVKALSWASKGSNQALPLASRPTEPKAVMTPALLKEPAPLTSQTVEDLGASTPIVPPMTPAVWSTINKVNDKVNRAIARRTDADNYGQIDHWATPLALGQKYGDCEDYVLEKRRALLEAGLPLSALSIAVVTTSWGESHAVLLVATDQGEYVLDNINPWVLPWQKANLRWHERQVAGSPFRWAMVKRPLTFAANSKVLPAGGR